ncbi:MAG TPA: homocysteine S-methyltransferase family protein [Longimicrobiales bacterium]
MKILSALARGPLLADGGMGTQLQQAGLEPGGCGDLWNLERPAQVQEIHRSYVDAGARLITTNTFGANRIVLERYGEAARAAAINQAGAELARTASGPSGYVLGDIGPIGAFIAPLGEYDSPQIHDVFAEQAAALIAGGADAIIVETMTAIEEAVLAVQAARAAGAALVIATMAFDRTRVGPRTMMGITPEQAAESLVAAGAGVVGANCGASLEPEDFLEIVRRMRRVLPDVPLIAQPNAGLPQVGPTGATSYPTDPERFAEMARLLVAEGAAVVGGCCGTTPAHIKAMAQLLRQG